MCTTIISTHVDSRPMDIMYLKAYTIMYITPYDDMHRSIQANICTYIVIIEAIYGMIPYHYV